jgi:hypothetical protein
MSNTESSRNQETNVRQRSASEMVLPLLCAGQLLGVIALGILPLLVPVHGEPSIIPLSQDTPVAVLVGLAIALLLFAAPVGKKFLRQLPAEESSSTPYTASSYTVSRIVTFALWEGVAVIGFVIYCLRHNLMLSTMLCGAAFGAMVTFWPKRR